MKKVFTLFLVAGLTLIVSNLYSESLCRLVQKATAAEIQGAINRGAKVGEKAENSMTPLMIAAANNRGADVIGVLLGAGAKVNERDMVGNTPLMYAAQGNKNPDVIELLLKAKAGVNDKNGIGDTPLLLAAGQNPNPQVISVLLKAKADVKVRWAPKTKKAPILSLAAQVGNAEVIDLLVKAGAEVNASDTLGNTPLMAAAERSIQDSLGADGVQALLKAGAKTEAVNANHETALVIAAKGLNARGNLNIDTAVAVIQALITAGANQNIQVEPGRSFKTFIYDVGRNNYEFKSTALYKQVTRE